MFFDSDGRQHPIFLIGGGEMGARIRDHAWASTPLGPPERWPQSLRSALSICLNSSFPTAIYWGPELRLLYNDAWAPIPAECHPWALGRQGREVWADIWHVVGPQFAQVMDAGHSVSLYDQHLPMVRAGRVRETYWNYSFTPIRGEDGSVMGVFNQGNETTPSILARREAEAEVDRLGRLFAQAPGAIAILRGPRHVFELVNPAYEALVGRTDLIGRPVADAMPEVAEQGFVALLDGVFARGEPENGRAVPVRLRRDGGSVTIHVDFVYQPLFDADDRTTGIFAQITDVTRTARAVAALRESEEFSRSVLQASGDCMVVLDLDGVVSFVNESGVALLEQNGPETLLGARWVDLWPAEGRAAARQALRKARGRGRPIRERRDLGTRNRATLGGRGDGRARSGRRAEPVRRDSARRQRAAAQRGGARPVA